MSTKWPPLSGGMAACAAEHGRAAIRPALSIVTTLFVLTLVLTAPASAQVDPVSADEWGGEAERPPLTKAERQAEKAQRKAEKKARKADKAARKEEEKLRAQEEEAEEAARRAAGIPSYAYDVDIEGLKGTGLESSLKDRSDLVRLRKEDPASIWDLRARIRRDINGFADVLRAEGYYGARINYTVARDRKPIAVTITITPGDRFTIGAYSMQLVGPASLPPEVQAMADKVATEQVGQPARSEIVVAAFGKVMQELPQLGYPRAKLADQDFKANHLDGKLTAKVRIETGPRIRFGATTVDGLETVKKNAVLKVITWEEGEQYDSRKVAKFREELTAMNLFSTIRIDSDDPLVDGDEQPMKVRLRERDHRSIGATASYSTVNGFGGSVFWEHRNIFGAGERLIVEAEADQKLQQFTGDLTKPRFLRNDQKLLIGAEVAREDTDAFLEYRGVLRAGVEREVTKRLRVRLGTEASYLDTRDAFAPTKSILLGLPALVAYDRSDDLLDPTTGFRLGLKAAPYLVFGDAKNFVTMEGTASAYLRLDDAGKYVVAGRVKLGALFGANDIRNIPASKRFYSGGGNSIRGYGYQAIGPVDPAGEPIGGKSLFEVGAEVRIKVTDTWGVVPFFEGGSVFDSALPDFSQKLRWGAGIGVRYYTGFGPVRLDVAFPINGTPADDDFQIYVSIGQAF
ncbi:autotransporter assembly complex family protein [Iodidimonas sp. SYSU 1G8]|uniref:autotransporter assembly complex protein TamA n=1 Tax=Iodidimonas sp. SYSU 1G8 TaxID=3133967 RepID=UPI0031FEB5BF